MPPEDFFIGWDRTPSPDRRFLLAASLALVAGGGGLAAFLSTSKGAAGSGTWDQGVVRTFVGSLTRSPYPQLLTTDVDGRARTAFLVGAGKDGIGGRLPDLAQSVTGAVAVRGTLIRRGDNVMIAVNDTPDWIAPVRQPVPDPFHVEEDLGPWEGIGEILDAKCWFGAMRPANGKVHKSCAALCVRGGLPVAFCTDGLSCGDASSVQIFLDETGAPHGLDLLPLVADPVFVRGRRVRVRDIEQVRVALADIRRI
jgi:hypothetical protein